MKTIEEKLIECFNLDGYSSSAEYLNDYIDSTKSSCDTEEQQQLVQDYGSELFNKFKMDTEKYPIIARLKEALLMNLSEEQLNSVLDTMISREYAIVYECLSAVLDEFKDGLDDIDSVIGLVDQNNEVKVLM